MPEPGRNDPCSCGSGKKYKKCCLARRQDEDRGAHHRDRALSIVLDWLVRHHEDAVDRAVEDGFLASFGPGSLELAGQLPGEQRFAVFANAREWLVAEGTLVIDEVEVRALDLFLEHAGELLTEEQRRWLEALAAAPLSLFTVAEARPAEGVMVSRVGNDGAAGEPFLVGESRSLKGLQPGDEVGLRVVPWEGGYRLSEAHYLLDPGKIERELETEGNDGEGGDPGHLNAAGQEEGEGGDGTELDEEFEPTVGEMIIDLWLEQRMGPFAAEVGWFDDEDEGEGEDRGSEGTSRVLDRYQVRDEAALRSALEAAGTTALGAHEWELRAQDSDAGNHRAVRLELHGAAAAQGPILEVWAPGPERADWAQDQLLEHAATAVRFLERRSGGPEAPEAAPPEAPPAGD